MRRLSLGSGIVKKRSIFATANVRFSGKPGIGITKNNKIDNAAVQFGRSFLTKWANLARLLAYPDRNDGAICNRHYQSITYRTIISSYW
jgi:hypothetical protein